MRSLLSYSLILLTCCWISPVRGQSPSADSVSLPGIFDLLYAQDVAEITVKTNLSHLLENKRTSDEYMDGEFTYEYANNVVQTLPVKVKCRGRYRRMKCEFPPFKLKFKKDDLAASGLNEFNELKLVTHCLGEKERSKDLINREYLTYKLYNILTPNSFRVQLVKVTYLNTKGKPKKIKGWGILIEDSDELAHRIGGEKEMLMGLPDSSFHKENEQMAAMFNFMIGNGDWDCELARNIEMIRDSQNNIMIVPYDFDFSGVVNAPYAVPNSFIGQKSVRDRVYLGIKHSWPEMLPTILYFQEKKEEIMAAIQNADRLAITSKTDITSYLKDFYKLLENEEEARMELSSE